MYNLKFINKYTNLLVVALFCRRVILSARYFIARTIVRIQILTASNVWMPIGTYNASE